MAERTVRIRFDGSARGLEKAANKAARDIDKFGDRARSSMADSGGESGKSFFRRFTSAAGGMALSGMTNLASKMGTGLARAVQSNPWIGLAIAAAIVAVAVPAMVVAGAAIGAALVGAIGAGIAGLGVLVQAQTDKVKSAFDDLKTDVTNTLQDISKPMQGVILDIFNQVREVVDFFAPTLRKAFQSMEPHLKRFFNFVFEAFKQFKPAIKPVTEAFNTLLDAIGPMLPVVARMIAQGIKDIATTIKENPGAFKKLVAFFLALIPMLIDFIGLLMDIWVWFANDALPAISSFFQFFGDVWRKAKELVQRAWDAIVSAARSAWGWVKGIWGHVTGFFEGIWNGITSGVSTAMNWVEQRFSDAKNWVESVWDGIRGFFSGLWDGITGGLEWAINGAIGLINDAIGGINWILRQANKLPGVSISTIPTIPRLEEGGHATAGRTYLVGEAGPELFTPSSSGTVTPNDELTSAGGPQVIENHIEIGGEVVRVVRSEIRSSNQSLRRAVVSGAGGAR